ncbi:hypothetical protein I79_016751 [Cricetulus griseus]|uniref:Uncharacterized protein n=1 Tax=Cricetulus griseus TaxID=10029 RepID=G3I074_CRIGR|nr:hypothetical protein I79_016751 [Cricetulus griseus]
MGRHLKEHFVLFWSWARTGDPKDTYRLFHSFRSVFAAWKPHKEGCSSGQEENPHWSLFLRLFFGALF